MISFGAQVRFTHERFKLININEQNGLYANY
jgi:hypothetical protein